MKSVHYSFINIGQLAHGLPPRIKTGATFTTAKYIVPLAFREPIEAFIRCNMQSMIDYGSTTKHCIAYLESLSTSYNLFIIRNLKHLLSLF